MPRHIAFLRSINVGGHTVKMEELRRLFTAMGFLEVDTLLASGNVIFSTASRNSAKLEKNIEAQLLAALGYEVATFVRSVAEVQAIAGHVPFEAMPEEAGLYIVFLSQAAEKEIAEKLLALQTETDRFRFHGRELYWQCLGRFSDSIFSGPKLEKVLQMKVTVRNATTIRKLAELDHTS